MFDDASLPPASRPEEVIEDEEEKRRDEKMGEDKRKDG